jgi:hypothetical protein
MSTENDGILDESNLTHLGDAWTAYVLERDGALSLNSRIERYTWEKLVLLGIGAMDRPLDRRSLLEILEKDDLRNLAR